MAWIYVPFKGPKTKKFAQMVADHNNARVTEEEKGTRIEAESIELLRPMADEAYEIGYDPSEVANAIWYSLVRFRSGNLTVLNTEKIVVAE